MEFEIQTGHQMLAIRQDRVIKQVNLLSCGFCSPKADHRVKIKKSENRDKYLDFSGRLRKLWNMKMTMIPIVVGVLKTAPKSLERGLEELEIRGKIETIQTMASTKILRRVLETW